MHRPQLHTLLTLRMLWDLRDHREASRRLMLIHIGSGSGPSLRRQGAVAAAIEAEVTTLLALLKPTPVPEPV